MTPATRLPGEPRISDGLHAIATFIHLYRLSASGVTVYDSHAINVMIDGAQDVELRARVDAWADALGAKTREDIYAPTGRVHYTVQADHDGWSVNVYAILAETREPVAA